MSRVSKCVCVCVCGHLACQTWRIDSHVRMCDRSAGEVRDRLKWADGKLVKEAVEREVCRGNCVFE